jgi:hypothetical protein
MVEHQGKRRQGCVISCLIRTHFSLSPNTVSAKTISLCVDYYYFENPFLRGLLYRLIF